jgi:uncharacterized membrane protein YesL
VRRSLLNRFTSHMALSLLWLVGCLPLVTAPAATAALFDTVRQPDTDPLGSFLAAARRHFPTATVAGLAWTGLGGVLAADLVIAARMGGPSGDLLAVALLALTLLYGLGSMTLFPVLVTHQARPIRAAVLVALLHPGRSLLALAVVAAAGAAVWAVPLTIVIVPSLAAGLVWRLCQPTTHTSPSPEPAIEGIP